ncbi:hypothetical protein [Colwellia sp. TT2012]|uniref:hypothetical protein n=1 Tax=Colwellia sp. TT2012 TaxID=1720342 RepID=UPI0018D21611|nr:hypothetical protein [Colwellia sp. TT2012]
MALPLSLPIKKSPAGIVTIGGSMALLPANKGKLKLVSIITADMITNVVQNGVLLLIFIGIPSRYRPYFFEKLCAFSGRNLSETVTQRPIIYLKSEIIDK